jgi:hypothetical protein
MKLNYDRKIVLIALLAIFMLAAVVLLRPVYKSGVPEPLFLNNKVNPEKLYDIVVVGDSRVMRGIVPEEIDGQSDLSTLNFGFRSAPLNKSFLEAGLALVGNENSQRAIVMGVSPNAFTATSFEDNGFESAKKKSGKLWSQTPEWYYRIQQQLSAMSLTETINLLRGRTANGLFENHHADGWIESHLVPANKRQALPFYRVRFIGNQVKQEIIDEALAFVQQATDSGVAVFGFWPPVSDEMKAIEDEQSGFDYPKYIAEFKKRGGVWLEPDSKNIEAYDASHLGPESARLFSSRLGLLIRHNLNQDAENLSAIDSLRSNGGN